MEVNTSTGPAVHARNKLGQMSEARRTRQENGETVQSNNKESSSQSVGRRTIDLTKYCTKKVAHVAANNISVGPKQSLN